MFFFLGLVYCFFYVLNVRVVICVFFCLSFLCFNLLIVSYLYF